MRIAKLDLLAYGPFRGLDLDLSAPGVHVVFGRNEDCGLRCLYHGWKFDVDGNIV